MAWTRITWWILFRFLFTHYSRIFNLLCYVFQFTDPSNMNERTSHICVHCICIQFHPHAAWLTINKVRKMLTIFSGHFHSSTVDFCCCFFYNVVHAPCRYMVFVWSLRDTIGIDNGINHKIRSESCEPDFEDTQISYRYRILSIQGIGL